MNDDKIKFVQFFSDFAVVRTLFNLLSVVHSFVRQFACALSLWCLPQALTCNARLWRSGFYPMAFATILPKQKKTTAKAAAKCTRFSFCYVYPYLHNRYQRTPTHIRTVVVLTLLVAMDLYLFLFVFVFVCFLLQFFLLLTLSWTMLVFTGRNSLSVYNLHSFCFHEHYFFSYVCFALQNVKEK